MWGIFKATGEMQVAMGFDTKREALAQAKRIEKKLEITGLVVRKLV